jgi:hypothetical protein
MKLAISAGESEIFPTGFGEFLKEYNTTHRDDKLIVDLIRDLGIHMLNHLIMLRKKINKNDETIKAIEAIKTNFITNLATVSSAASTNAMDLATISNVARIKPTIMPEPETGIKAAKVLESDEEVCPAIEWNVGDWELIQNDNPNLSDSGPEVFII